MKVRIEAITKWTDDERQQMSYNTHASRSEVLHLLADEIAQKSLSWNTGLPFVWCSDATDEEGAVAEALEAYATQHCEFDMLKPSACDYELVE